MERHPLIVKRQIKVLFNPEKCACLMYATRMAPFEKLLKTGHPRLQKIGQTGVNNFSPQRDAHLAHEKRAAIKGELA